MPGKNIFNSVLLPKVDTNRFDLSHDVKMSFKMGELVPTCCMEVIPGDKVSIQVQNMLRFAPLISPVMHRVRVTTHYFFVPYRILWANWEKFITTGAEGSTPPVMPTIQHTAVNFPVQGSLANYLGLPVDAPTSPQVINALNIAAYFKIWDEYYRDQNLQSELFTPLVDGDVTSDYITAFTDRPLKRAWQHDYFTAALPWAQKGDSVQVPLTVSDSVPVEFTPNGLVGAMVDENGTVFGAGDVVQAAGPSPLAFSTHVGTDPAAYDPRGTLTVDVQADAVEINTLRRAFRIQEWLERNARAGTRYIENILAHFGVRSSDARLQRPEYLGGAKQNMVISEVLATAQDISNDQAIGQMAGHGISVGGGNTFNYRAEEHGVIIGIINVQPDTAYQQGVHRMFSRLEPLDFCWPTFANLGEQEVLQKELYVATANPNNVFGYVPRYADYKYLNSRVAGDFMTNLSFWHLGRIFETDPALNEQFISSDPSTRIFAVDGDADHIWAHVFNNIGAVRKLPRYGIPSI